MKKLTALLLCILLMFVCSVTAFAQTVGIDTVVPDSHTVTVTVTGDATAELDGEAGTPFTVERLSEPVLRFIPADGKQIVKITLNGEDITDQLDGDTYKLAPVYEDMTLDVQVQTENVPEQPTEAPTEQPTSAPATEPATAPATQPATATPDSSSSSGNSLPQTGQIVIPIFILLIIGGLFIVLGVRMSKSKKSR